VEQVIRLVKYYIASSYYSLLADASLGLGRPEVKPSTPEPLPVRLKELPGKLGWMNWEPMSLTGCLSEERRSQTQRKASEVGGEGGR